jgi:serine/threonine protein kinase
MLASKWRLGNVIGRGATSTVYAAAHRSGKAFAIKVLHPALAPNSRARRRFIREAYIANRVMHDGVPAIFDDGVEGQLVFLVMELLEGSTVEEYRCASGGRLPASEALAIGARLLEILVVAHGLGIVHRDIKPSNLFLTHRGDLKLLDFGIARLHEEGIAVDHTSSGALLGTPGFIAPEQARGRFRDVDARTDIWAVGASLFRLLTGEHVHDGETVNEKVIAAATLPAPSLASIDAEHEPLSWIVDRALAREPRDRFQHAVEMLGAVRDELSKHSNPTLPRPICGADETRNEESMPSHSSSTEGVWSAAATRGARIRPSARVALGLSMLLVLLAVVAVLPSRRGEPSPRERAARVAEPRRGSRVETARVEPARQLEAETVKVTPTATASAARVHSTRTRAAATRARVPARAEAGGAPNRGIEPAPTRLEDVLDARE